MDYFTPPFSGKIDPAKLSKIEEKLHVKIIRQGVQKKNQTSEIKLFKLTIKPEPTPVEASFLAGEKNFDVYQVPSFRHLTVQQLFDIYSSEGDLAIHGGEKISDAEMLEFTYCLFSQYDTFYRDEIPDLLAIQKKLEELRVKRPGMIRDPDHFRIAITLALKLHLTKHNKAIQASLIDEQIERAAANQVLIIRNKKIDKQNFIELDALLSGKNILTTLENYRHSKNSFLSCNWAKKRRKAKLIAVITLFKSITTWKEKATDNKIDFHVYLDQFYKAIHNAIKAIDEVSAPENFGFFKRQYKQKKQRPGSHLLPILIELQQEVREKFASQLAEIEEQEKRVLPPIDLSERLLCPLQTTSRHLRRSR